MSAENKSESNTIDYSKTREIPDVLFDERSNKENLTEEIHSSMMQDIKID